MDGTLGAADRVLFRESVREAALQGGARFGAVRRAVPFARGRYRTAAG
jgi:hypothetical protein